MVLTSAALALTCTLAAPATQLDADLVELIERTGTADEVTRRHLADELVLKCDRKATPLLEVLAATRDGCGDASIGTVTPSVLGRSALEIAFTRFPQAALSSEAIAFASREPKSDHDAPGEPFAAAALDALRGVGGSSGLRAALGVGEASTVEYACRFSATLGQDLRRRLEAEPALIDDLSSSWNRVSPHVGRLLLDAAVSSGVPRSSDALVTCLSVTRPDSYDVLFALTGRVSDLSDSALDALITHLGTSLKSEDPITVQASFQVAGECGAVAYVDAAVAALDSPHAGVRRAAHGVLCDWSGQQFPPDARPWKLWLAAERKWRDEVMPGLVTGVSSRNVGRSVVALRTLGHHRLFRDTFVVEVAAALERSEDAVAAAACDALASLGARERAMRLASLLNDPSANVRTAAHRALRSLTGYEIPSDSERWLEALERNG